MGGILLHPPPPNMSFWDNCSDSLSASCSHRFSSPTEWYLEEKGSSTAFLLCGFLGLFSMRDPSLADTHLPHTQKQREFTSIVPSFLLPDGDPLVLLKLDIPSFLWSNPLVLVQLLFNFLKRWAIAAERHFHEGCIYLISIIYPEQIVSRDNNIQYLF